LDAKDDKIIGNNQNFFLCLYLNVSAYCGLKISDITKKKMLVVPDDFFMFSIQDWFRLLRHPCGMEGAHNILGNSAYTNSILQAKGEPGQALVPNPTLETSKQHPK
jgi:hypothetical protein